MRFTSLHCAVDQTNDRCHIHIDETGFVLGLPKGFALTPDKYDHIMNEYLFKTKIRDWLDGKISNEQAKRIVKEVIRRTSFIFTNATNGYAGLDKTLNSLRQPRHGGDVVLTGLRIFKPIGVSFDVYENDRFKVQVTGTALHGDRSITISLGGDW